MPLENALLQSLFRTNDSSTLKGKNVPFVSAPQPWLSVVQILIQYGRRRAGRNDEVIRRSETRGVYRPGCRTAFYAVCEHKSYGASSAVQRKSRLAQRCLNQEPECSTDTGDFQRYARGVFANGNVRLSCACSLRLPCQSSVSGYS